MKRLRWLLAILAVLAGLYGWVFWPLDPVKLIVSRQTTYLLGPLNPDGTVDDRSVIDQRLCEGVTKENNAAIPLIEAIGPRCLDEHARPAVLEALGLAGLPESGKYLVSIEDHSKAHQLNAYRWEALKYPHLSEWLAENEEPLAKIC